MVVIPVLLDRDRHQQIEHLDRRCGLPQREEDVVGQVPLAAPDSHQPGRFGRLEIPYIVRLVFEELVGAHRRVVDVLVRQRDMLQDRQITLLALEPLDELGDGIEAGQGVQRAAVMAGRHFGRARDRQRRGHQHRRDRHPGAQFLQRAVEDLDGRRILDELNQRFDVGGILHSLRHRHGGSLRKVSSRAHLLPGERLVLRNGEALGYIFRVFGREGQVILPQGWNAFTARAAPAA